MDQSKQLYLKPDEQKFLAIAVLSYLETVQINISNDKINFTPEARKIIKDMLSAGTNLKIKMEKLGFDMREMPPFEEGDQDEFLTKQS